MEQQGRFGVTVYEEFDGTFIARVDEVPGCFAGGASPEEAVDVLLEVIPVYVADVEGLEVRITNVSKHIELADDRAVEHRQLEYA